MKTLLRKIKVKEFLLTYKDYNKTKLQILLHNIENNDTKIKQDEYTFEVII